MSCYFRPKVTGATVFFTLNLAQRGGRLLITEIERLRWAVGKTRAERPFHVDAWVVLPDHMHAIWTLPAGDADFSTRWRLIKSRFSRGLPKGNLRPSHELRGERGIWQRRFWEHHVRGEAELKALVQYCWTDPVKHGFVARPEDWPFSSLHRGIETER